MNGDEELREKLLALVGIRYDDPRFDDDGCWGFVRYCYSLAGIELPKNIWRCRHICEEVRGWENPAPFRFRVLRFLDVVYFRDFMFETRHVGIALDGVYLLQAGKSTNGVARLRFNQAGVAESIQGIYRWKEKN